MGSEKKKINKKEITLDIIEAAKVYNDYFVGRTFMYVFENKFIQVTYRVKDFKHLTGVTNEVYPNSFFKDAKNNRLSHNQIKFDKRHPYDLARKKSQQYLDLKV